MTRFSLVFAALIVFDQAETAFAQLQWPLNGPYQVRGTFGDDRSDHNQKT